MSEEYRWMCVAGSGPQWIRSAALSTDGTIYIPAVENEDAIFLAVIRDGAPSFYDEGHLFIPLEWAKKEWPEQIETYNEIELKIRTFLADEGGC